MTVKELKKFIFESYYRRIEFTKENWYYSIKHQKKKHLKLFASKLIKKCVMLIMLKNTTTHFWKTKQKIC